MLYLCPFLACEICPSSPRTPISFLLHFERAVKAQIFFPSQSTIKIDEQVSKLKEYAVDRKIGKAHS
uniref:Uncharacterized protein n=1 Tax=Solanum tuberosum TaxID=4113 RepID=M1C8H7_SOLTU